MKGNVKGGEEKREDRASKCQFQLPWKRRFKGFPVTNPTYYLVKDLRYMDSGFMFTCLGPSYPARPRNQ